VEGIHLQTHPELWGLIPLFGSALYWLNLPKPNISIGHHAGENNRMIAWLGHPRHSIDSLEMVYVDLKFCHFFPPSLFLPVVCVYSTAPAAWIQSNVATATHIHCWVFLSTVSINLVEYRGCVLFTIAPHGCRKSLYTQWIANESQEDPTAFWRGTDFRSSGRSFQVDI